MVVSRKLGRVFSLVLVCLMLVAACGYAQADSLFVFNEKLKEGEWTYPVPLSVFDDPMDVLRLINRENLLDKEYPNQDIEMYKMIPVTAPVTKGNPTIRSIVNDALVALAAAGEEVGVKLYVGSAYRNYRSQEVSHYNRVKDMGYDDGIVQMAGASEHQAGLAADVVSWKYKDRFLQEFGETDEGKWLAANCARFGFIIRYAKDKEEITGVKYEPWHLRYVGTEAAAYIMETGLSLEEFTAEWQEELARYNEANGVQ